MRTIVFQLVVFGIIFLGWPCQSHSQTKNLQTPIQIQATSLHGKNGPSSIKNKSQIPSTLQLPGDEIYSLLKLRIQKELENEIVSWVKTKFWFAAIISLLFGFFGVRALVRELVSTEIKDAMRASAEALAAAASARESIKEVRAEASKYKEIVDTASITASSVNEKLLELSSRIDTEGERSVAAAEIKITALSEQLDALRDTVTALASSTEQNKQILKQSEASIVQSRKTAEASEAEFHSNSYIKVGLVPFSEGISFNLADIISKELTNVGFKIYKSPWGKKEDIFKGTINITHQPFVKDKAEFIAKIVENEISVRCISCNVKLTSTDRPVSNNDTNIVLLFE